MSLAIKKDPKPARRKTIPRRVVRKRPLTTSPTTAAETKDTNNKRRRNKSQISDKLTNPPDNQEDWIVISETEVETTEIAPTNTDMVGTQIHNFSQSDEREMQRQVLDLSISSDHSNSKTPVNTNPKKTDDNWTVDDRMNWDRSKSLLNSLQDLVTNLNKINEENELLTGHISDEGDFGAEATKSGSDHTYCHTPDTIREKLGLARTGAGTSDNTGETREGINRDFPKENNSMLHLVMDTLLTVNKNIKRNNESLSGLEGRMNSIESNVEASIRLLNNRVTEQESACLELLEQVQKDKVVAEKNVDSKIKVLKDSIDPKLATFEETLQSKITEHKTEMGNLITDNLSKVLGSNEAKEKISSLLAEKAAEMSLAEKKDVVFIKKQVEKHDTKWKTQISENVTKKFQEMALKNKDESAELTNRIKAIESSLTEKVNICMTNRIGILPLALKSEVEELRKCYIALAEAQNKNTSLSAENFKKVDTQNKKAQEWQAKNTNRIKTCEDKIVELTNSLAELQVKNVKLREAHDQKLQEIDNLLKDKLGNLERQTESDPSGENGFQYPDLKRRLDDYGKKIEKCCDKVDKVDYKVDSAVKYTQGIDARSRKNNIIIDQLMEDDEENTLEKVNRILDHTLSLEERAEVYVGRAYRLGAKTRDLNFTRKIFVEFTSPRGKDIVMYNARKVTKSGNDGRPYYLSDDIPDSIKRRRADLHKYYNFLKKKGVEVEKAGDDMIIEGRRWAYNDLNKLAPGLRIMDSRMISCNGMLAFQSAQAPLSNLFVCDIKYKGQCYTSLEQAYQHRRAIHHSDFHTAKLILYQDDPYEVMNQMKQYRDNTEWIKTRVSIMEELVTHKADQVEVFKEVLKHTSNLALVENTWNGFWGTGCAWISEAVWLNQFKGQNQLGKILEKVRSST